MVLEAKQVPQAPESGLMKALHFIQTPLYATAGVVEEYLSRKKGYTSTPYSQILSESANNLYFWEDEVPKRRTTYHDIVENKALAFGLDILGDPLTYVPMAWFAKGGKIVGFGGRYLIKAPIKGAFRGADKILGTQLTGGLESVADGVRRAVIPFYDLKRVGGDELMKIKRKHIGELEYAVKELSEKVKSSIDELVPDARRQMKVFDLVERRPVKAHGQLLTSAERSALMADDGFRAWLREVTELAPLEKKAFNRAIKVQNYLERIKIEYGFISRGQAEGFRRRFGINYLPHYRATKADMIDMGEQFIDAIKAGDAKALEKAKVYKLAGNKYGTPEQVIDDVTKYLNEIRGMGEITDPIMLAQMRKGMSFTYPRVREGSAAELEDINMKLAEVLGVEAGQVARAAWSMKHVKELQEYIVKKNMMFDKVPTEAELVKEFGKKRAREIMRGGFRTITDTEATGAAKGFAGKVIPKPIADEVMRVMSYYKNPQILKGFLDNYRKVQNIWKAWTLSVFVQYHSRNAISNLWNNFLAGMNPHDPRHMDNYRVAAQLLFKKSHGTLSPDELTMMKEAEKLRVLNTGMLREEIGETLEKLSPIGRNVAKVLHPAHNPAVRAGFRAGTFIEDHARLAHYLWAKNIKKLSPEDAAASVNKYLFDYKYGLTPWEKKVFRDFLVPFYSWTRFNLPLQLEMLALRPGRMAVLPKGMRAVEDILQFTAQDGYGAPKPNEVYMADWMRRATKIRLRYNPDREAYEYFFLDNWIPSADLLKMFDQKAFRDMLTGLISPFTKLPIEIAFNYNLFRKQPLKRYKGEKRKLVGIPLDPRWLEHPARAIRLFNETDKMYHAFLMDSGEVSKAEALTRVLLGKVYPYRPEAQKKWWAWETSKRISQLKNIRRKAEKYGQTSQMEILDDLIEELTAERDYFRDLKI